MDLIGFFPSALYDKYRKRKNLSYASKAKQNDRSSEYSSFSHISDSFCLAFSSTNYPSHFECVQQYGSCFAITQSHTHSSLSLLSRSSWMITCDQRKISRMIMSAVGIPRLGLLKYERWFEELRGLSFSTGDFSAAPLSFDASFNRDERKLCL